MTLVSNRTHQKIIVLPLLGMLLFIVFYVIAALNYPGGSYTSIDQVGFSFKNNYLCDLLDTYAINGDHNNGKIHARIALGFLCFGLVILWSYIPKLFATNGKIKVLISVAGILAMITTVFLASGVHDIVVRIAGVFGVIALLTCLIELYKANFYILFALGVFCLIQFSANYYIYETGILLFSLPIIQKFTFISFILWFVLLNLTIYKHFKNLNHD